MARDLAEAGGARRHRLRGPRARARAAAGSPSSTRAGRSTPARAVLCAGPWADRLAIAAGADPDPRIVPFRGAYLRLRPERRELVRSSIYPVPDPDLPFLGMHLTRTASGEVLLGPTALFVGARDAYRLRRVVPRDLAREPRLARNAADDASLLAHRADRDPARVQPPLLRRRVPPLRPRAAASPTSSAAPTPASGRRRSPATASLVDDFVVSETERAVHVRNAPSPAATSSLALAELIADRADGLD